jgi:hypothetical protein
MQHFLAEFVNTPLVLFGALIGCVLLLIVLVSIVSIKEEDYLCSDKPGLVAHGFLAVVNPVRRRLGLTPFRLIPAHKHDDPGAPLLQQADRILSEIRLTLKHSPMSAERKLSLERQAADIPNNLTRALWKLAQLRRLSQSIDPAFDQDGQNQAGVAELQDRLLSEMAQSVQVLSSISISLLKVELTHNDAAVDRLLSGLQAANQRLEDISTSYAELRGSPL